MTTTFGNPDRDDRAASHRAADHAALITSAAAKPIRMSNFIKLLTPFTFYVRTGTQEAPRYELIELALEQTDDEAFEAMIVATWSSDGKRCILAHAPRPCSDDITDNDHAALNLVHESVVPAPAYNKPQFIIIK